MPCLHLNGFDDQERNLNEFPSFKTKNFMLAVRSMLSILFTNKILPDLDNTKMLL